MIPGLITGSVDLYAETIARRLGVADWYANTPLVFNNADNLVDYHYEQDQAAKKLQQLQYFCAKHRLEPRECLAVGDSDNDLELFRATRHGILLTAEGQSDDLRDAAWREAAHLSDVLSILESGDS
jgi:phosphoserine phosphatase